MSAERPYLEARGLRKRYGHVEALRGADFEVRLGEILALVGDNGAGKSTLVKTLSGVIRPDEGTILFNGEPTVFNGPIDARRAGLETVYQDLALAGALSPAANLFLGRELTRPGILGRLRVLDNKSMEDRADEVFDTLGVHLASRVMVAGLSGGQQQSVAVARAAAWASKIVFLDEPTAALGVAQTQAVRELIKRIRAMGQGVVLISHNMNEVLELADRVQVMRRGERVALMNAADATVEQLVTAMTYQG